ncbi:UNVERIFIED_CONTAM: hypothetical protein Slati_0827900 [Sesamum latifolium]|uniref:Uncharacterized protein n=1 Tax=Sesamum latifolium TaxID=2727402 RepID=A0AAW2XL31_9LAMI
MWTLSVDERRGAEMTLKTRPLLVRKGRRLRKKSRKQQKPLLRCNRQKNCSTSRSYQEILTKPRELAHLGEEAKKEITLCLQRNADIFAWTSQDLEGIDPQVITHHLNIDPNCKPVKQKKRHFRPEKDKIIQAEYQNPEEMENVHRFPRLEQSMPQRFLSTTTNRSARGFHIRLRIGQHDGCLTRIPSDPASPRGPEEVQFHHL